MCIRLRKNYNRLRTLSTKVLIEKPNLLFWIHTGWWTNLLNTTQIQFNTITNQYNQLKYVSPIDYPKKIFSSLSLFTIIYWLCGLSVCIHVMMINPQTLLFSLFNRNAPLHRWRQCLQHRCEKGKFFFEQFFSIFRSNDIE